MGTAEAGRPEARRDKPAVHTFLSAALTETASTDTSKSRPSPIGIGIPISTSDPAWLSGSGLLYPARGLLQPSSKRELHRLHHPIVGHFNRSIDGGIRLIKMSGWGNCSRLDAAPPRAYRLIRCDHRPVWHAAGRARDRRIGRGGRDLPDQIGMAEVESVLENHVIESRDHFNP